MRPLAGMELGVGWSLGPFNPFRSLLGIAGGIEAPTYAELYSGAWKHPKCSGYLR